MRSPERPPNTDCHDVIIPEVREVLHSENKYRARNWDREIATRYVFGFGQKIVEASYFAHFLGKKHVKHVVELPTSYGCPIGCQHCAATLLNNPRPLTAPEIMGMVEWIATEHGLSRDAPFLTTFSGIGEGALHREVLSTSSRQIHRAFKNTRLTFTTVGYDTTFIDFIDKLANGLPTHVLQISYLHHDTQKLMEMIPAANRLGFDFGKLIQSLQTVKNIDIRLNYVVIKGYNDSLEHVKELSSYISGLGRNFVVRVAMLNSTATSGLHNFREPKLDDLKVIQDTLHANGIDAYIFASSKNDHMNCGQLAGRYGDRTLRSG